MDEEFQTGDEESSLHLAEALSTFTLRWAATVGRVEEVSPDQRSGLCDGWFALLSALPTDMHVWAECVFTAWGQHMLPDLLQDLHDGFLEVVIDEEFYSLIRELPRFELQTAIDATTLRLDGLREEPLAVPHRPIYRGPANRSELRRYVLRVPRLLSEQEDWCAKIYAMDWDVIPENDIFPMLQFDDGQATFVIVHLFSGRRRHNDFHDYMVSMCRDRNIPVIVLSADTAVSPWLGDLTHTSTSWCHLWSAYRNGWIAGTMCGAPCETYSEARHHCSVDDNGAPLHNWPRPLRDAKRCFGKDGLRFKEHRQLSAGQNFSQQGMNAMASHCVYGGAMLSEHPAPPRDPARASVWTSPAACLLRGHPNAKLHIVKQYVCGAQVGHERPEPGSRSLEIRHSWSAISQIPCDRERPRR